VTRFEFSGDFEKLKKYSRRLAKAPDVLYRANEQMAEEALGLVREGFQDSYDPYGQAWEPLKLREGNPLQDSGGLMASWYRHSVSLEGFKIASAKAYAKVHQVGSGIFGPNRRRIVPIVGKALRTSGGLFFKSVAGTPPRKMVPDNGNIPEPWLKRFVDTAGEVLRDHFKTR
jgi:phage gpG-like protein